MARIICDNTDDVDSIQQIAFKLPNNTGINSVKSCSTIPHVDLEKFKEEASSKWVIQNFKENTIKSLLLEYLGSVVTWESFKRLLLNTFCAKAHQ